MPLFWIDNICVLLHAFWKLSLVEPLNQYFDIYSREHFISCHLICIFHNQYVLLCHFNNIGVYELAHHDWFALQSLGIVLHNTEVTRKVLTWLLYFTGWVQCYSTIAMRTRFPNVQPPATYTGCCRRVELSGIGERVCTEWGEHTGHRPWQPRWWVSRAWRHGGRRGGCGPALAPIRCCEDEDESGNFHL